MHVYAVYPQPLTLRNFHYVISMTPLINPKRSDFPFERISNYQSSSHLELQKNWLNSLKKCLPGSSLDARLASAPRLPRPRSPMATTSLLLPVTLENSKIWKNWGPMFCRSTLRLRTMRSTRSLLRPSRNLVQSTSWSTMPDIFWRVQSKRQSI